MGLTPELAISCHCGAARQTVRLRTQSPSVSGPQDMNLCHCATCRHNTGILCASYVGIERPASVQGLVEYRPTTGTSTRLFCAACGCHVFWKAGDGAFHGIDKNELWAVATGVIIGSAGERDEWSSKEVMRYARHINTAGTKDGGLSSFIRRVGNSQELEVVGHWDTPPASTSFVPAEEKIKRSDSSEGSGEEVLNAFCHCKTVQFRITRPNAASGLPRSNFPDLMVPYHTDSPRIQNPGDEKWWLRPGQNNTQASSHEQSEPRRYLAGTCACRSCRLTSGFEIQTWAFVPRANVFFNVHDHQTPTSTIPLDFATLPPGILTSYESTQGVRREFCVRCGATVFWRDRWRPELLDVSVGLLDADEGARAETWLDWWTGRVSFAEDAGNERTGETARRAKCLIDGLEEGLRTWAEEKEVN